MIKVDIGNIWGEICLPDLLNMEKEVFDAHMTLTEGTGEGRDFLGWMDLPVREGTREIRRIQRAATRIREESDVCVVVGIGGSYLGPRAAIELLQGPNRNMGKGKGDPQIYFAGNSLSTRHWNELNRLLDGKDFSVISDLQDCTFHRCSYCSDNIESLYRIVNCDYRRSFGHTISFENMEFGSIECSDDFGLDR